MKITSYRKGIQNKEAYCTKCSFNEGLIPSRVMKRMRKHMLETGHSVEVFTESLTIYRPTQNDPK